MKQLGNIEKLPSGSYRLRYKKDGVSYRKTIKVANITEARKELNRLVNNVESNLILPSDITFRDLANEWASEYLEKNATTTTFENAVRNIKKHIIPKLGKYKIKDITPYIINNFINEIKELKQYSNGTIKKIYNHVRAILNYAYRMELIQDNPCNRIKLNLEDNKKQEIHYLDEKQAKKFLNVIEKEDIMYQLIYKLALFNGLRRSEILGLKWEDFDFKHKTFHVQRTRQKISSGTEISKTKTKNSNRILTIPEDILTLLKEYKNQSESDLLFPSIYPDSVTRHFRQLLKTNNLPSITLHDLRHTCATLLLSNGIDIKTVSAYLGHSNIQTTMIYLHVLDDKFKDVTNKMSEILK